MNTPCWEAGGWTALVGGNPTERIGRSRVNDIEGKVTRVGASERGQRTSFKIVCCNFSKRLFLKAGWRWVDRNTGKKKLYDLQSKKNQSIHFMPSLIKKLFRKSDASAQNDGLTQPQREAIVDLLS